MLSIISNALRCNVSRNFNSKTNHDLNIYAQAFTIIEFLSTITILGILTSFAVPSVNNLIQKTELNTTAMSLFTTLKHARSHALSKQVMVIVCQAHKANAEQCSPTRKRYDNWQNGWLSYADLNQNNELDDTDEIILINQPTSNASVVFNQSGRLRFFPIGSARSAGFYVCSPNSTHTQYIRLLHTGRSRISTQLSKKQLTTCQNQVKN